MKKLYFLNEEEKQRILNMHKGATKRNYLNEDRMLLNESNPIVNFLRNFFKKGALKKIKPDVLIKSLKNDLVEFLDNSGNLIIAKPTILTISSVEDQLNIAIQAGKPATIKELESQLLTLQNGGKIYEINKINLGGLNWTDYLKSGEVPNQLTGDFSLIKNNDYVNNLDEATLIKYEKGKLSKLDTPSSNRPVQFDRISKDISSTIDNIKSNIQYARKIKVWVYRTAGVAGFYLLGNTLLWLAGAISRSIVVSGWKSFISGFSSFEQGVKGETDQDTVTKNDQFIKSICNLKSDDAPEIEWAGTFGEALKKLMIDGNVINIKKYIKENITSADDIYSFNKAYYGNSCFWVDLRNDTNDKHGNAEGEKIFNRAIVATLAEMAESPKKEKENLNLGKALWESFSKHKDIGNFDNIEYNNISKEGFNKCSCIYEEHTNSPKKTMFIRQDYADENNVDKYVILLKLGDDLYHPNCGKVSYKEYADKQKKYTDYFWEQDEYQKKLSTIKNISDLKDEANKDGLIIGGAEWTEKFKEVSKDYVDYFKKLETKTIKCN